MRKIILSGTTCCFIILLISFPSLINGNTRPVSKPKYPVSVKPGVAISRWATVTAAAAELNDSLHLDNIGLSKRALEYALKGYNYLQKKGLLLNSGILSICDFSQPSRNKRLYIIDMENKKLVLNTYVAHGRNSGSEYARYFSNSPKSLKSSLGFYVTGDTYLGGNGLSLRISGVEKGFNDKALRRNIVVHGSEYVGDDFVSTNNFCGRSYGCPAVPAQELPLVINTIKNGSCLFIYNPNPGYIKHSRILNS